MLGDQLHFGIVVHGEGIVTQRGIRRTGQMQFALFVGID
jgi:hypothetical protein